jgi:hypothetical protein
MGGESPIRFLVIIAGGGTMEWDIFISHAKEDKDDFVVPLVRELLRKRPRLKIWFDNLELELGDQLLQKIDQGLTGSRFGVVVLSRQFFRKRWTQSELAGLMAREELGKTVILPVWYNISRKDIAGYSPILASRHAVLSSIGLEAVADEIIGSIEKVRPKREMAQSSYASRKPAIATVLIAGTTLLALVAIGLWRFSLDRRPTPALPGSLSERHDIHRPLSTKPELMAKVNRATSVDSKTSRVHRGSDQPHLSGRETESVVRHESGSAGVQGQEAESRVRAMPKPDVSKDGQAPNESHKFSVTTVLKSGRTSDYQLLGCRYSEWVVGSDYNSHQDKPELAYYSTIDENGQQPCVEGHGTVNLANLRKLVFEGKVQCGGTGWYRIAVERRDGQAEKVFVAPYIVFHVYNSALPAPDEFLNVEALRSIVFN